MVVTLEPPCLTGQYHPNGISSELGFGRQMGLLFAIRIILSLHVVNFSEPVDKVMSLEKLERHLFSLPSLPDAVPYVTSYYQRSWGICISERVRSQLQRGNYRVLIEAEFKAGRVPFAECKLMGETSEEILLTSYSMPSLNGQQRTQWTPSITRAVSKNSGLAENTLYLSLPVKPRNHRSDMLLIQEGN